MLYFEKNCEVLLFGSLAQISENMQKRTFKNSPLKIWKFCPLWCLLFQKKMTFSIFYQQIFRQTFIISKNLTYMGQVLLKLRAAQLTISFTWHILQPPKNRQKKIAINSLIYLIENNYQKKCLVKVWSFLTHWLENDGPLKFLQNWTEKAFYRQLLASLGMIKVAF